MADSSMRSRELDPDLYGVVTDFEGRGLSGVSVGGDNGGHIKTVTDATGHFRLAQFFEQDGGSWVTASDGRRYDTELAEQGSFLALPLGPATRVDFVVKSSVSGLPVHNANIVPLFNETGMTATNKEGRACAYLTRSGESVTITAPGFAAKTIQVSTHQTPTTAIVLLDPGLSAEGRILDANGKPMAKVAIWFFTTAESRPFVLDVETDVKGFWRLDGLEKGLYTFFAAAKNVNKRVSKSLRIDTTNSSPKVDFEERGTKSQAERDALERGASERYACDSKGTKANPLRGRALLFDGSILQGASVFLHEGIWSNDFLKNPDLQDVSVKTNRQGEFIFSDRPSNSAFLYARRPGMEFSFDGVRQEDIVYVDSVTDNVTVHVPRGGVIKGTLTFADGKVPASFCVLEDGWPNALRRNASLQNGSFEVETFAPGTFEFTVAGPDFIPKTVSYDVPADGKTLDVGCLLVESGVVLSGDILDEQGRPVADVFIGVDVTDTQAFNRTFDEATVHTVSDQSGHFTLRAPKAATLLAFHPHWGIGSFVGKTDAFPGTIELHPLSSVCGTFPTVKELFQVPYLKAGADASKIVRHGSSPGGQYCFENLEAGRYCLELGEPSGLDGLNRNMLPQVVRSENTGFDIETRGVMPHCFELKAGENRRFDF